MKKRHSSTLSLNNVWHIYSFRAKSSHLRRVHDQSSFVYPRSKSTLIIQNDEKIINRNEMGDFKVRLNIGGVHFETFNSTLSKIPGTRLSKLSKNDDNYDLVKDEFFFDRSPNLFECILNLFRTGELHIPSNECGSSFSKELEFWNIDEAFIPPCCWLPFNKTRENKTILNRFDSNFFESFYLNNQKNEQNSGKNLRNYLWSIIKYPYNNKIGYFYSLISTFFILLSMFNLIFLSFRPWYIDTVFVKNNSDNRNYMLSGYPSPYFKFCDGLCIAYFTLEFLLELVCCPSIKQYFRSLTNLFSVFSLVFYYIEVVTLFIRPEMSCFAPTVCTETYEKVLGVLQLWRLLRLLRLFKSFTGMRVMAYTLKYSGKELVLIVSMILIGVTVFGSLIYVTEGDPEHLDGFYNVPISLWFAVTTMTTVGFGDRVPSSALGYIVGSLCALSGVLVVAFTVPIAVSNFTLFYSYTHSRIKYLKK